MLLLLRNGGGPFYFSRLFLFPLFFLCGCLTSDQAICDTRKKWLSLVSHDWSGEGVVLLSLLSLSTSLFLQSFTTFAYHTLPLFYPPCLSIHFFLSIRLLFSPSLFHFLPFCTLPSLLSLSSSRSPPLLSFRYNKTSSTTITPSRS